MIAAVTELATVVDTTVACQIVGIARSTYYRLRATPPADAPSCDVPAALTRPPPPRALSADEQTVVRQVLESERFQDTTPREVYATLLDEGTYLCSWRTMYRILALHAEVRERRDLLRHARVPKPEVVATKPKQGWSWDITKFKGPEKWLFYYTYVIIDLFSRYIVGWMVMEHENGELAEAFIAETCAKEGIARDQLTLHADRGSPMVSKTVAQLLSDLGITDSHSRPHVSNDNPYSEAQFKTLKYRPDYPDRFGSIAEARAWMRTFVAWYNQEHHHTGIGLLTPAQVHSGKSGEILHQRQHVLRMAYAVHPARFVGGVPQPPVLPAEVWINRPTPGQVSLETAADSAAERAVLVQPVGALGSRDPSAAAPLDASAATGLAVTSVPSAELGRGNV